MKTGRPSDLQATRAAIRLSDKEMARDTSPLRVMITGMICYVLI